MTSPDFSRVPFLDRHQLVATLTSVLGDQLRSVRQPLDKRVYLEVESSAIQDVAKILFIDLQARLQTASAIDAPKQIELLYHWAFDSAGLVVSVRTYVNREQPEIASITQICPAAEWIEREMRELMGIVFVGHPDPRHLLLQEDWPEGRFPLRRDYRKD